MIYPDSELQQNDRLVGLFQRDRRNHVEENNLVYNLLSESTSGAPEVSMNHVI